MIADPECCLSIPCPTEEVSNPYLNTYLEDNIDVDEKAPSSAQQQPNATQQQPQSQ